MHKLTVRKVGNSLGVTLPAQAANALHVREGDVLYLTAAPDGFRLTPYDPEFAETMAVGEDFMRRYKNTLRDLAK
jgi:putative addiction module antidote